MRTIRFVFMFLVYIIVISFYYTISHNALVDSTKESIQRTLITHQALRQIVRKYHIPEIRRLQKKGLLPKAYSNPHLTSGTLLTQTLHDLTIPIQLRTQKEATSFKFASLNPINSINLATPYEAELFKSMLTQKKSVHDELIDINNKSYLLYATPFIKMSNNCLRCHGNPKDAPAEQIKKYGTQSGYYFKEGDPSALIVMRAPLDEKAENLNKKLFYRALLILLVFLCLYGIAEWVISHLKRQKSKITQTQKESHELKAEVNKDPMTGLLNRRSFDHTMEIELNRSRRKHKYLFFFYIDIDYFKQYNDYYGHLKGDEVLNYVAKAISKSFKRSSETTYRLGGEEFGVISSSNDSVKEAEQWSERLLKKIRKLNIKHIHSHYNKITISIGVSIVTPETEQWNIDKIIQTADEALYEAKSLGRNRVVIRHYVNNTRD